MCAWRRGAMAMTGWGAIVLLVMLTAVPLRSAQTPAPDLMARNLAENVLGQGTVQRVQVSAGGALVDIAWEAALYRPTHTVQKNREQLRGEAELATGSIMGIMRPEMITFAILLGGRTLAAGWRMRGGEFTISYAPELGG